MAALNKMSIIIMVVISLTSCIDLANNYTMPNWDSDLNIPITNGEYRMEEILDRGTNLSIDTTNGANQYILHTDTMYSKFAITDYLKDKIKYEQDYKEISFSNIEFSIPFAFPENIELDSADFSKGNIVFEAENLTNNLIEASIDFPNFTIDGKVIHRDITINSSAKHITNIDLSNSHYSGSKSLDRRNFIMKIKCKTSETHKINYRLKIADTEFSFVSGLFPSKNLGLLSSNVPMELDEMYEGFREKFSSSASELLLIGNYISDLKDVFDLKIQDAKVTGKYNNQPKELKKNGLNDMGDYYIRNGKLIERITNANSNLGEFLSFVPTDIDFSSQLIMNPDSKRGSARITDSLELKLVFSIYGKISVDIEFSDTVNFDVDINERDLIAAANFASLFLNVENGVPLGSIVKCAFTDENYNEYFRKEFEISPAMTDGDGKSSEAVESELVFEINKEEVNYLAKTKKLILNLVLNTFQSKEVILRSSDKLTIKAYCKLNYRVKI